MWTWSVALAVAVAGARVRGAPPRYVFQLLPDMTPNGWDFADAMLMSPGGTIAGEVLRVEGAAGVRLGVFARGPFGTVVTDRGITPGGASLAGVNDAGWVAGTEWDDHANHATLWRDGGALHLPVPAGSTYSEAWAINNAGLVAGDFGDDTVFHACVWRNGVFEALPVPNSYAISAAVDVNEHGDVIVAAVTENGVDGAFVVRNDVWTELLPPAGITSHWPRWISDNGRIVGYGYDAAGELSMGVVWDGPNGRVLSAPSGWNVTPMSLARDGTILGVCHRSTPAGTEFIDCLWEPAGQFVPLRALVRMTSSWRFGGHSFDWAIASDGRILCEAEAVGSIAERRRAMLVPRCGADLDDGSNSGIPDNAVTIDDLLFFLKGYEAGSDSVDVDDGSGTGAPDGGVTIDDLEYFLDHFASGC